MQNLNNYFLSFLNITEKSAFACHHWIGKNNNTAADQAAVEVMRQEFSNLDLDIEIVIGEGERDKAPRLYTGEKLGNPQATLKVDVAVDPLEGTNLCAQNKPGAISVMSLSLKGGMFKAPDIYMKKLACGPKAKGCIDLELDITSNIQNIAKALNKPVNKILVGILNRKRHQSLIEEVRQSGASVRLVDDGDVTLALETALDNSPIDLLVGTGGAPEGVLAASGLKCLGGDFQGQLVYQNEEEKQRTTKAGVKELDKVLKMEDLVSGDAFFYATGVTKGFLLDGIVKQDHFWESHSLVLSSQLKQDIKNRHYL